MAIKLTKRFKIYHQLPLQDPPKYTQIWIFGLKICHLATLFSGSKKCPEDKNDKESDPDF
jgi:hypothetical protein